MGGASISSLSDEAAPRRGGSRRWKKVCASFATQPAFTDLAQDLLDANDNSGEVRQLCTQQCVDQHKKDAAAKANAKSAKLAAAMVDNTDLGDVLSWHATRQHTGHCAIY